MYTSKSSSIIDFPLLTWPPYCCPCPALSAIALALALAKFLFSPCFPFCRSPCVRTPYSPLVAKSNEPPISRTSDPSPLSSRLVDVAALSTIVGQRGQQRRGSGCSFKGKYWSEAMLQGFLYVKPAAFQANAILCKGRLVTEVEQLVNVLLQL